MKGPLVSDGSQSPPTATPARRARPALGVLFPSLRHYQPAWLRYDVIAGVAAGTVVIPQAMAYATIAGLPVAVGLYTCMVPMVAYALFGGSRSLSISTTSTIAVLSAATLATLPDRSPDALLTGAFTLTVLVGISLLLMRLFRLGSVVEQISPATMTGVKTGVGFTVAVSQLPALLGLSVDLGDQGFFGKLWVVLGHLGSANLPTGIISVAALAILFLLRRFAQAVPGPLVVVVAAIVLVALTDIESRGVTLVAAVPSGLPGLSLPVLGDLAALLPGALAIAVMAFMETVLVARAQRNRSEPAIDSNQELLANGLAATLGGLFQAMPPAGGFSQSAVNQRAGARTQAAGLTTALLAVVVALWLGPLLGDLPNAILAAMVLVAVLGLISIRSFRELWAIDRTEFAVAIVTAIVGLTLGLLFAVLVGVVLTLVLVLRSFSRPMVRELHQWSDGVWRLSDADDRAVGDPSVLVLHLTGSLYTGNARPTQDAILHQVLTADPKPSGVVLDVSEVRKVTTPLLEMLESLDNDLRVEGIGFVLAELGPEPAALAGHARWFREFAATGVVHPTVIAAVASVTQAASDKSTDQQTPDD